MSQSLKEAYKLHIFKQNPKLNADFSQQLLVCNLKKPLTIDLQSTQLVEHEGTSHHEQFYFTNFYNKHETSALVCNRLYLKRYLVHTRCTRLQAPTVGAC